MARNSQDSQNSLMGVLNHCSTASGERSLRANLLQPPTSLELISSRHLSVQELAQNPALLHSLQIHYTTAVSKFMDVERLMWLCVQVPNLKNDNHSSEIQTNYVLLLKTTLDSLPALRDSLQPALTPYFRKVLTDLGDERFAVLLANILEVINEDARVKKGFASSQFQRCFAIKTGINGLLDMARAAYSNLVANMHEKVQEMSQEYDLPLRSSTTGNKGLHIQLSITRNSGFSAKDLPEVFIQVSRTRNLITCTTEELVVMNHRMKQILLEVQLMSNSILQELLHRLREHVGCLYTLCELVSELDLLVSFAQVSSADKFVQPTFGDEMKLEASRHPILDVISPSTPEPNNVFASLKKNFHIITGPNMGGKSIYIKQVALLQIMAQVGCFVPAESAEFKIIHQIFSRMGFDDSIEYNASSFVYEMQEMQYILRSVGPHSLVLIDELCRSTDYEEGTAVAWVLCEQLIQTSAVTFFTTHYLILTKLQTLYSNVINHQMVTEEAAEGRLKYTHKLAPGVTRVMLYGLKLAQTSALPVSVLQRAKEICDDLAQNKLAEPIYLEGKTETEEDDDYIEELLSLVDSKFTVSEVQKVRLKLRQRYGMELENENEISLENQSFTLDTTDQNMNAEDQTCPKPSELIQKIQDYRENPITQEKVSHTQEPPSQASTTERSEAEAVKEIPNANNPEPTPISSMLTAASDQGHSKLNMTKIGNSNITKLPCHNIESSSPKTPVQHKFITTVSKPMSRNALVGHVPSSPKLHQILSSPKTPRGIFSLKNNTLDFTPGANSVQTPQHSPTTNYSSTRFFQSPKELDNMPKYSCHQNCISKTPTSNSRLMSSDEFKTPDMFKSKKYRPSNKGQNLPCLSAPINYQNPNIEFDHATSTEFNLGNHFLNAGNSPDYNRQICETSPSLNECCQTFSDVQYSAMQPTDNRSNLSEPWHFQRRVNNDKLATHPSELNTERSPKRRFSSHEISHHSQARAGPSTFMVEGDRLEAEDLFQDMNTERPSSPTPQSFEQAFLYSQGTRASNTPMILDLHPDLSHLPRNIYSQSAFGGTNEDFMEE